MGKVCQQTGIAHSLRHLLFSGSNVHEIFIEIVREISKRQELTKRDLWAEAEAAAVFCRRHYNMCYSYVFWISVVNKLESLWKWHKYHGHLMATS